MTSPTTSRGEALPTTAATTGFAVTPSDVTVFTTPTRGLYVGGAGNLTVTMSDGTVLLFAAVPAGSFLPLVVTQVRSTGTAATLITAVA